MGRGGGGELLTSASQRCLLNVCLNPRCPWGGESWCKGSRGSLLSPGFAWIFFLLFSRHLFLSYTKRPSVSFPSSSFLLRARVAHWTC